MIAFFRIQISQMSFTEMNEDVLSTQFHALKKKSRYMLHYAIIAV